MKQCAACSHSIDPAAKLCPYCGANPDTGERIDTEALLREVFKPRDATASENVIEYARQRQGVVIAITVFVGFLILAGLHQFVTLRNARVQSDAPAVPLSEITDVTKRADETTPVEIPDLDFQYDGTPRAMQTYIVESGAAAPAAAAPPAGAQPDPARPAPPRPAPR